MARGTSDGKMVSTPRISRMLPSFTVEEKDLPAIKSWKVGKKYALAIEVEMVSHSKGEYASEGEKKTHEARLRITGIHEGGK